MAKQELPVDFKDDVLQAEMAGKRKYRIIQNEDGTISLEDVTNYSQIGSNFGAAQMNATNLAVNESFDKNKVIDSLVDIVANEATGYAAGALAVRELNGKITNGGKGYVRFPDGTQICYGTLSSTGYTSVNHNLIFAKPFIDTEYVVILTKGANGKFITEFGEYDSSGNRNRSVDKCSVHYDATTANYTKTISWVAIGRWK